MITKMDGGTFRMLSKDKRVAGIKPAQYGDVQGVRIDLAPGWQNDGANVGDFPDWESARNWVRKAVKLEDA